MPPKKTKVTAAADVAAIYEAGQAAKLYQAPAQTPAAGADVLAQATAAAQPGQEPQVANPLNDMNPVADWAPGSRTRVDLAPVSDRPVQDSTPSVQTFKLQVGTMGDGRFAIRKTDEHGQPLEDWRPEPIHDLDDARALPDVTGGVYTAPMFAIASPLAIRAFKDHDGRSMAVVWTGYTLAKAALND